MEPIEAKVLYDNGRATAVMGLFDSFRELYLYKR